MSEALNPCPFCASDGEEIGLCYDTGQTPAEGRDWFMRCYVCHVETMRYDTRGEAAAAWNRRAPINKAIDRHKLARAREAVAAVQIAAWELCDDTEGTPVKDEDGTECLLVPKENWDRLSGALDKFDDADGDALAFILGRSA